MQYVQRIQQANVGYDYSAVFIVRKWDVLTGSEWNIHVSDPDLLHRWSNSCVADDPLSFEGFVLAMDQCIGHE